MRRRRVLLQMAALCLLLMANGSSKALAMRSPFLVRLMMSKREHGFSCSCSCRCGCNTSHLRHSNVPKQRACTADATVVLSLCNNHRVQRKELGVTPRLTFWRTARSCQTGWSPVPAGVSIHMLVPRHIWLRHADSVDCCPTACGAACAHSVTTDGFGSNSPASLCKPWFSPLLAPVSEAHLRVLRQL